MKFKTGIVAAMVLALAAAAPAMAQGNNVNAAMMSDHTVSAQRLIGEKVYDDQGISIGSVVDVVVKEKGGEPNVILSVGDYLGTGKKMVSVPFSHVRLNTAKAAMTTTKQELNLMAAWAANPQMGGGG